MLNSNSFEVAAAFASSSVAMYERLMHLPQVVEVAVRVFLHNGSFSAVFVG